MWEGQGRSRKVKMIESSAGRYGPFFQNIVDIGRFDQICRFMQVLPASSS